MNKILALAAAALIGIPAIGQQPKVAAPKTAEKSNEQNKLKASKRCVLNGFIRDNRNIAVRNAQVFIYSKDSTIIASGYTDVMGHYETSAVPAGTYDVKIMYPTQASVMYTYIAMKPGYNPIDIKAEMPTSDTVMSYLNIAPKKEETAKSRKK